MITSNNSRKSFLDSQISQSILRSPIGKYDTKRGSPSIASSYLNKSHYLISKHVDTNTVDREIKNRQFKERFSKIKRTIDTKMLGGGPLFPILVEEEKHLSSFDSSSKDYKA